MQISSGDRIQLKANGETATEQKLANGEIVTVKTMSANGRIQLLDEGF